MFQTEINQLSYTNTGNRHTDKQADIPVDDRHTHRKTDRHIKLYVLL